MAKPAKQPDKVFLIIKDEDEFVGYFKDFAAAFDYVERNDVDGAIVLEVVAATEIVAPEEPQYDTRELNIKSLLG